MHGAGNDYVYIDCTRETIEDPARYARLMSDRHFGIGSDGLVLILPSERADFRMRMFNADGTEAEMCGNASRCVGKYVYDYGLTGKTGIALETGAGIKHLTLHPEGGEVGSVTVDMGTPVLEPADIPVGITAEKVVDYPLEIAGETMRMTCVSMGNPHAVFFVESCDRIPELGPVIENHPLFPRRTNVEFVEIVDRHTLRMRVWERGAGETLACGTGACASLVAAVLNGLADNKATLHLLGGDLQIEWNRQTDHVMMTGPAETVFEGEWIKN